MGNLTEYGEAAPYLFGGLLVAAIIILVRYERSSHQHKSTRILPKLPKPKFLPKFLKKFKFYKEDYEEKGEDKDKSDDESE